MAVAKRQGRSKDQSEDFRQNKQNKQHSWLSPICIGQAQGRKKHIKGGAKALSLGLSLPRACTRSLSLSFSLSFSLPTHFSTPFSSSLGFSCYLLNGAVTLKEKTKKQKNLWDAEKQF